MTQQSQLLANQAVKTKQKAEVKLEQQRQCSNCGTPCQREDKFCEECGMPLQVESCVRCNTPIQPGWEICPQCGQGLQSELCSFCGSSMEATDAFCLECGNPRTGINCPECNTLNFRSFCRKCNHPLNELAEQEMLNAKRDPVFQEMLVLAQELADLEDKILSATSQPSYGDEPDQAIELSKEDQKLIGQYKDLFAGSIPVENAYSNPSLPNTPTTTQQRPKLKLNIKRAEVEQDKHSYKEKLEEMKRLMEKLRPEGDVTPQLQRNYYSARKLPMLKKTVTKNPVGWVCNLCGCQHKQPSECAQPELGGTWIYEDVISYTKGFDYPDD